MTPFKCSTDSPRAMLRAHQWRNSLLCLVRGPGECLKSDSICLGLKHYSVFVPLLRASRLVCVVLSHSSAHNFAKANSKATHCSHRQTPVCLPRSNSGRNKCFFKSLSEPLKNKKTTAFLFSGGTDGDVFGMLFVLFFLAKTLLHEKLISCLAARQQSVLNWVQKNN